MDPIIPAPPPFDYVGQESLFAAPQPVTMVTQEDNQPSGVLDLPMPSRQSYPQPLQLPMHQTSGHMAQSMLPAQTYHQSHVKFSPSFAASVPQAVPSHMQPVQSLVPEISERGYTTQQEIMLRSNYECQTLKPFEPTEGEVMVRITDRETGVCFDTTMVVPPAIVRASARPRRTQAGFEIDLKELKTLVMQGMTNKQLSEFYSVSENTIKRRIKQKLKLTEEEERRRREALRLNRGGRSPLLVPMTEPLRPTSIGDPTTLHLGPSRLPPQVHSRHLFA